MNMVGLLHFTLATAVALAVGAPGAQTGASVSSKIQSMTGVVKTVSVSSLTLEHAGHEITFALDSATRAIAKGGARDLLLRTPGPIITDIIKAGDRVTVRYRQSDGAMNAVELRRLQR
jgi:hypothetical protein